MWILRTEKKKKIFLRPSDRIFYAVLPSDQRIKLVSPSKKNLSLPLTYATNEKNGKKVKTD